MRSEYGERKEPKRTRRLKINTHPKPEPIQLDLFAELFFAHGRDAEYLAQKQLRGEVI